MVGLQGDSADFDSEMLVGWMLVKGGVVAETESIGLVGSDAIVGTGCSGHRAPHHPSRGTYPRWLL